MLRNYKVKYAILNFDTCYVQKLAVEEYEQGCGQFASILS